MVHVTHIDHKIEDAFAERHVSVEPKKVIIRVILHYGVRFECKFELNSPSNQLEQASLV